MLKSNGRQIVTAFQAADPIKIGVRLPRHLQLSKLNAMFALRLGKSVGQLELIFIHVVSIASWYRNPVWRCQQNLCSGIWPRPARAVLV